MRDRILRMKKNRKKFPRPGRPPGSRLFRQTQLTAKNNALSLNTSRQTEERKCVESVPKACLSRGCIGFGHVNGVELSHITLSGCPTFHNLPPSYWTQMREREEGIVLSGSHSNNKILMQDNSLSFTSREPNLDGLAGSVFIYQFRRAQQKLASDPEKEVREHLLLSACLKEAGKSGCNRRVNSAEALEDANPLESRIKSIVFGEWEMQTWYSSMYPPTVACHLLIYVCEFCLAYMSYSIAYKRHRIRCKRRFPPGNEIYRKNNHSFFEVDGDINKEYCRNLCLLAKLYLKQKTAHELEQVSSFFFYVLTLADDGGCHIVGYFSKQKPEDQGIQNSSNYYNLSCLLTLPHYQCQGYGRMLVEFSYLLSRLEGRVGSPERPLSDHGLVVYQRYWRWVVISYLNNYTEKEINLRSFSETTGLQIQDIVSTLLDLGILKYIRTEYFIVDNKAEFSRILSQMRTSDISKAIDQRYLVWSPRDTAISTGGEDSP